MGKPKAPEPPDMTAVAQASKEAAELNFRLGQEQLSWAKKQYYLDRGVTKKVIDSALDAMNTQTQWAKEDRARYERDFRPLEEQMVKEANEYDTPEKQEAEAGKAQADVSQQFDMARVAAQDRLESFGIDPSQTRSQALDVSTRTQEAAARASAGNQARTQVQNTARQLRGEAVNVGRGLPSMAAQGMAGATNSGNQAVNSGLATTATGSQAMNATQGWMANGQAGINGWGNALASGYNMQLNAWKANQEASSGLGSALGLIGGMGLKLATGGMFAEGGAVEDPVHTSESQTAIPETASPTGGQAIDDVPATVTDAGKPVARAALNVGEFVIPADVVRWEGEKSLQNLINKARTARENPDNARPDMRQAIPA